MCGEQAGEFVCWYSWSLKAKKPGSYWQVFTVSHPENEAKENITQSTFFNQQMLSSTFTFLSDFVLEDHFLHIFNDVTA